MSGRAWRLSFGANVAESGVRFRVWAPGRRSVDVVVYGPDAERVHPLAPESGDASSDVDSGAKADANPSGPSIDAMSNSSSDEKSSDPTSGARSESSDSVDPDRDGWFSGFIEGIGAGARYRLRLDGGDVVPDPASRAQPDGVHEPSEVVDPSPFRWTDEGWRGVLLEEMVIHELHVGTFTPEGTFDAAIQRLDELVELGVTAIEPMPVAAFPGERNWGYDGVFLFAPAAPYGGPEGFRRLVDAAHARGLAVVLDVVYNHLGPEGNYLHAVTGGRYFTSRHCTPWGDAVDYSKRAVREFVIGNALHWAHEYHVDGLRLDATHAILDDSPVHVLTEMETRLRASLPADRNFVFIAEDEGNERHVITPSAESGLGIDAVWADDFHHQLRRHVAGDHESYFADFSGTAADLALTLRKGWYYEGQPSSNRGIPRGTPADDLPPPSFVHCIQNHDQVGNRALGDRLSHVVPLPVYRAASALLLLTPYTPLLWMGQEWAASTPFQYFTDHPEELGKLVTEGRRREFRKFSAFRDPAVREKIPDPQARETFTRSKLDWSERERMPHAGVLALHRELLALRRAHPAFRRHDRSSFAATDVGERAVALRRTADDGSALLLVASFGDALSVDLNRREGTSAPNGAGWELLLSTEEGRFGGESEGEVARLSRSGVLEMDGPGAVVLRV